MVIYLIGFKIPSKKSCVFSANPDSDEESSKTNCNVCYDHTSLPWQLDIKVDTVLEVLRRNAPGGEYSYPAAHSHAPAFFLRRGAALSSAHRSGLSYLRAKKAVLDSFSPTGGKNESRTAKKNPTILRNARFGNFAACARWAADLAREEVPPARGARAGPDLSVAITCNFDLLTCITCKCCYICNFSFTYRRIYI